MSILIAKETHKSFKQAKCCASTPWYLFSSKAYLQRDQIFAWQQTPEGPIHCQQQSTWSWKWALAGFAELWPHSGHRLKNCCGESCSEERVECAQQWKAVTRGSPFRWPELRQAFLHGHAKDATGLHWGHCLYGYLFLPRMSEWWLIKEWRSLFFLMEINAVFKFLQ